MAKYIAGVDAGTTGTKLTVFTLDGEPVGSAYREYPCTFPGVGCVEQDANLLWKALCDTAKEVISKTGIDPKEIGSLAISSQRGTFIPIDKDWNPIHDSIVWSDGRSVEETKWVFDNIGYDKYYDITGVPISALWAYPKMKWFIDHKPDVFEKTYLFVNGQEWLLKKLGADDNRTDPSSLALNGMMDLEKFDWSGELLDAIGLSRDKLPDVASSALQVGVISKEAAEATGFAEGMPICTGGGDQQCAAIGAGVIKEGTAEITIGTSSVMVAALDQLYRDPNKQVLISGHANPGKWDMEGDIANTGGALKWYRDTFCDTELAEAKATGKDVYDIIGAQAESAPVGCKGYMFMPWFAGQLTPNWCDSARGGSLGLTFGHDKPVMARAVMEGVAYELRMVVDGMTNAMGKPFDTIRLAGGGAKSPIWSQIQADVYGFPVETVKVADCGIVGAAVLGAAGAGIFNSIEEGIEAMVHTGGMIEPNMANHAIYNDCFGVFKDAFFALRDAKIYDKLGEVVRKNWG